MGLSGNLSFPQEAEAEQAGAQPGRLEAPATAGADGADTHRQADVFTDAQTSMEMQTHSCTQTGTQTDMQIHADTQLLHGLYNLYKSAEGLGPESPTNIESLYKI